MTHTSTPQTFEIVTHIILGGLVLIGIAQSFAGLV